MKIPIFNRLNIKDKIIFMRVDLNMPRTEEGFDTFRLEKILYSIEKLLSSGVKKVILVTHFGRPKGKDPAYSTKQLIQPVEEKLGQTVKWVEAFSSDIRGPEKILLMENIRFFSGEKNDDPLFSQKLASMADIYVNEAFSVSHRFHSSIVGVPQYLPHAAGYHFVLETESLNHYIKNRIKNDRIAVVGGAKISTKFTTLHTLLNRCKYVVVVGAMAHTLLKAKGIEIGESLYEKSAIAEANKLLYRYHKQIILPVDFRIKNQAQFTEQLQPTDKALDIGPKTIETIRTLFVENKNSVLIWNGPAGLFEQSPFDWGTLALAKLIAKLTKDKTHDSIVGGGDTVAAVRKFGMQKEFTHLSTGGGAFLAWFKDFTLPGIIALEK